MTLGNWANDGSSNWAAGKSRDQGGAAYFKLMMQAMCPIGAIIPWLKSYTNTPASLPLGWVECNGQTLSDADSPINGEVIPNLNASGGGTKRFLRGATTSGGVGGSDTIDWRHQHSLGSSDTNASNTTPSTSCSTTVDDISQEGAVASSLPPYYEAVMIMRVK